uniref:60S acidic ribosomal protein P0 n=1 Tax=Suberites domuncula TaxID=55567 RepID=Q4KTH7_SUBDO|nr:L10e/P0 [Suberites domuncula]
MGREDKAAWKSNYVMRLLSLFDEYKRVLLVNVDNVGSKQMQQIRISLRGKATILMGKNTTIRKALRGHLEQNPNLEKVLPHVKGNIGFVFTHEDMVDIREIMLSNQVGAPAKAGAIAPVDVFVPASNTGLGPEKTSFFQALSIATKISRGTIEILSEVHLIKIGEKVGASEATLLQMLKIFPFTYGLKIVQVYDSGSVFAPSILDITEDDLIKQFMSGLANVAAVSLQIGYPTVASVPHSIVNGFKNLLAVAVATDITFKEAEQAKAFVADPSAFAALVPAAQEDKKEDDKAAAAAEESEEESDDDMGFGLFD